MHRSTPFRRTLGFIVVLVAGSIAAGLVAPSGAAAVACDRYAAVGGNDAGPGTAAAPYGTVQRLAASLAGGGTGCIVAGTRVGNVIVSAGGTASRRLVLTTAPGAAPATVKGIVEIRDSANYVTLDGLRLDGSNPPTANATQVMIFGDNVTLSNNEIFNAGQRICVGTGDANGAYGVAWYPVIEGNRIHDCGNKLTGSPSYPSGHALYLQADRYARVAHNYVYDTNYGGTTGGRGIQLWPDSQFATIEQNVVDNANQWSIIISGGAGYPTGSTRGTKVRNNIFSNPVEHNVTSAWWGLGPQPGVEVTDNCVFNAPGGDFAFTTWLGAFSYLQERNLSADPLYVDRAGKDFRLRPNSPCTGKGPGATRQAGPVPAPSGNSGTSSGGNPAGSGTSEPAAAPSTPTTAPAPIASTPSTPATAKPAKPSVQVKLGYRGVLRGRLRPTRQAQTAAARPKAVVTILRRVGGSWRIYARVRPGPAGSFAVKRRLWSRAPRLVFRAEYRESGRVHRSPLLVLRRSGKSPSRFVPR